MRESIVSSNTANNARVAQLNSGYLRLYSGTRPAGPDTALSGNTLLAELRFSATAFGASANRIATANAITSDSAADAAGIPTFGRCFASDGTTAVADCSVGAPGGTEEILLTSTDGSGNPYITAGATVSISSMTITQPIGA